MYSFETTINELRRRGFKMTPQRLAVIKYMLGNIEHPSALTIHKELQRKYPTLSFSTVYNTLNMLEKIDEVQSIHIFDDHLNYDPNTKPHIHFHCDKCSYIHDVFMEQAENIGLPLQEINGHQINTYELVFRGICRDCR